MMIKVADLVHLPYGARNPYTPLDQRNTVRPGAGTVIGLPDGRTTARIIDVRDERWRAVGSKTFEITAALDGPGTRMSIRELMDMLAGKTGGGPWSWSRGGGALTFSLAADAEFPLLQAMPHSCGHEPGETCIVRWNYHVGRVVCETPADAEPVRLKTEVTA